MAEGGADNITPAEEAGCPVCREDYKDPRSLTCGHHFCRGCLEGIFRESPQAVIKCPTCREETNFSPGSGVKGLQRPYLETLQEKVAGFLSKHQELVRNCDICGTDEKRAEHHCFHCTLNLCQACMDSHKQKAPSHKTAPLVDALFCGTHPSVIVIMYCSDCRIGVCGLCLFHDHADHHTINIETKADQSRQRLQEFLTAQSGEDKNELLIERIREILVQSRKLQTGFKESVSETRRLLKELEETVDEVERDTNDKLTAEIKTLTLYESDLKDVIDSTQSLVDHATYLTNTASDPELVEREKEFPVTKISGLQHIGGATLELPVFDNMLNRLCSKLKPIIDNVKVKFEENKIWDVKANIEDLKKEHTVSISHTVGGLTVDIKRQRFIARTQDSRGPLKVYSYDGQLLEQLGAGVSGLADCFEVKGVALDTKRDLYLAPCSGTLVLVDRTGNQQDSIRVGGDGNCGISYDGQADIYVMSDKLKCTVFLVNPATSQVTRQFASTGTGPAQFQHPYSIHVGPVAGVCSPCIVVSETTGHCLKLFDSSGKHLKTYGSPGSGEGQLKKPFGVITDPEGRVVVCDRDNKRVVCYSTDSAGQDHWECLLNNDWSGHKPWLMALDTDNMVLGVTGFVSHTLHIYK